AGGGGDLHPLRHVDRSHRSLGRRRARDETMTPRTWRATVLALAVGAAVLSCSDDTDATGDVPGGDPDRGREMLSSYGCVACHEVPGVDDAHGRVAPSLAHYAQRSYVAGI